ncbi:hypothetical protein [Aeromicrobium wangtongii]|uniref:Uncharacterized protein n=1 Tax=Aeromicrobium wangtongii TaxID=2969247 RepID=A0ABY5M6R1_9ACTN|nr:hypothetical protein [Aeromicrobium wangtongii]MCD9199492.1 hypothetical protein [Aeromicrobium wangtongii]UUP13845.1 hypothetical protein NQV15_00610 [Aeromicrobium wangtongii]
MTKLLLVVAAIWGLSGTSVIVMFIIDERSHRRSLAAKPPADLAQPDEPSAQPTRANHADHALA